MRRSLAVLWSVALLSGCSEDAKRASPEAGARDGARDRLGGLELGPPGDGPHREGGQPAEGGSDAAAAVGLAAKYPGDVGIDKDPAVVFAESFEEGSVDAVVARYSDHKNQPGMSLVADVPAKSSGKASMKMVAGGGTSATDLFKQLSAGHEQLFVRYYVKYQGGVTWHHTSPWIGGYNPPSSWPAPQAGSRPNGDDRIAVAVEPMGAGSAPGPRLDFYNYWMKMHSWRDQPTGGGDDYWGNTLIHQKSFAVQNDAWMCIEVQVKLNPGASSGAGAELAVWKDDKLVQRFTESAPLGYWVKDKFCPQGADGAECTDYPPSAGTTLIPLDLQFRSTTALKLNYLWPQNYVTEGPAGAVWYDDMVVATQRVGCLRQ